LIVGAGLKPAPTALLSGFLFVFEPNAEAEVLKIAIPSATQAVPAFTRVTTKVPARQSRNQRGEIGRKERKDRKVNRSNFLGAWVWPLRAWRTWREKNLVS